MLSSSSTSIKIRMELSTILAHPMTLNTPQIESEDFTKWNQRRLQLNPTKNDVFRNFHISPDRLTALKTRLVQLDQERKRQQDDKETFDFSTATPKEYQEQMVLVIKVLQMQTLDAAGTVNTGRRLAWLLYMDPIGMMYELFRLLMKNAPLLPKFLAVFNECRPCFELQLVEEWPNADEESQEILCPVYVLRKMFHQLIETGTQTDLKAFNTLIRQLSRSVVKITDGKPTVEQIAIVPATSIIADVLFSVPLTKTSVDFIFTLLNYMFGTGKETHVFVIQWKKQDDKPYLLPRELFCYLLLVYRFSKSVDSTRTSIPFVFRTLGVKLQNEHAQIKDAKMVGELLNELEWSEKFTLIKWLGNAAPTELSLEIPESLHRVLRHQSKRHYCPIPSVSKHESPFYDFFDSVFELATASLELAQELVDEMLSPLFISEGTAEELRVLVTCALIRQTQKHMEVENYKNIVHLLDILLKRLDWPLDLIGELGVPATSLICEVALKNELLVLVGSASLLDIGSRITSGKFSGEPSPSSSALANCFATESNRIISDIVTRFVSDQTVTRSKKPMIPPSILKALERMCQNVQLLVGKLLKTPLESTQLANLNKRLDEFQKQVKLVPI